MKRTIITLLALMLVVGSAFADPGFPGRGGRGGGQGICNGSGPGSGMGICDGSGPRGGRGGGQGFRGHGNGMGFDRGHRLMMLADELELTDEQRDRIADMMTEFRMEQIDRRADLQKARLQLRVLKMDDDASEGDVLQQIDKVSQLEATMEKARYQHHEAVMNVLTAEQQDKMDELRKTRRPRSDCPTDGPRRDGTGPGKQDGRGRQG